MASGFFKNVSIAALVLVTAVAAAFAVAGRPMAGLGALVAGAWIYVNCYFLFSLLEIGLHHRPQSKDRVLLLSVLKFPVLYLAGYFILSSRFFPVSGILAGLTAFMAAFTYQWTRANLAPAAERRAS